MILLSVFSATYTGVALFEIHTAPGDEFLPVLNRKEALKIEKEALMEWKFQFFHQKYCRRAADGRN